MGMIMVHMTTWLTEPECSRTRRAILATVFEKTGVFGPTA